MTEVVAKLVWPFGAGLVIGAFYFGVLWLTVSRLPTARRPGLVLFLSTASRLAVTIIGFYLVSDGRGDRLLACLAGFIIVRVLMVSRIRPRSTTARTAQPEHGSAGTAAAVNGGDSTASDT